MTDIAAVSKTGEIIQEFVNQVDTDKEFELKELKQILAAIYKEKNSTKKPKKAPVVEEKSDSDDEKPKKRGRPKKVKLDKDGNIKEKKPPSAYNNYVKEQLKLIKQQQPDTIAKELMKIVAGNWKTLSKQEQETYKTQVSDSE